MAIATMSGHVSRALEFYNKAGKYFSIGRTTPWDDETTPPAPSLDDFKLEELVALKKVDNCFLVIQDNENGTINYRDNKWRIVADHLETTIGTEGVLEGSTQVPLTSLAGILVGNKLRIDNEYEATISGINTANNFVTLDTPAPRNINPGAPVLGGAYVEKAKYVYIDCTLNYDQFPIVTYRQVGLQTGVQRTNLDVMKSAAYSPTGVDEFENLGVLEIIDNRPPTVRQVDQRETISIVIEF
jgi:hypothetical protein